MKLKCLNIVLLNCILCACARLPIHHAEQALRWTAVPQLSDDQDFKNLDLAVERDLDGLKQKLVSGRLTMRFGPRVVYTYDYAVKLEGLHELLSRSPSIEEVSNYIRQNFDFYQVYGDKSWGDVFVTGYYEPILQGNRIKTAKYSAPILTLPRDSVTVNLRPFAHSGIYMGCATLDSARCVQESTKHADRWPVLHGRIIGATNGPKRVEPFEPRAEIATSPLIRSQSKVIAWVDPVDAFFLQIQGSGRIELPPAKGQPNEIFVTYAGQNGYPYVAIGKFVTSKIPKNQITKQKLVEYIRSLPEADAKNLMDQNPSYVFFEKMPHEALTRLGVQATDGRTIATDGRFFTKGALAFLEYQRPVNGHLTPVDRFVFDQDTGGAIRGPGRVDLFVGSGPAADQESGDMRAHGQLFYLVPKSLAAK